MVYALVNSSLVKEDGVPLPSWLLCWKVHLPTQNPAK